MMSVQLIIQGDRVELAGNIDFSNVVQWMQRLDAVLSTKKSGLLYIDFKKLKAADGSALALMTTLLRHAHSSGIKINYLNVPEHLRRIAELYGVLDLLPCHSHS